MREKCFRIRVGRVAWWEKSPNLFTEVFFMNILWCGKTVPALNFMELGVVASSETCGPSILQYNFILRLMRHQIETFSALLARCAGNSPVTSEFPSQRPVTRIFDIFFDMHLNKQLSKQSWGWWFDTPSRPLWRHSNVFWLLQMCLVDWFYRFLACQIHARTFVLHFAGQMDQS